MSIDWNVVQQLADQKATAYMKTRQFVDGGNMGTEVKNAYLQGYMECAGERESLRVMVEKLEKDIRMAQTVGSGAKMAQLKHMADHVVTEFIKENIIEPRPYQQEAMDKAAVALPSLGSKYL